MKQTFLIIIFIALQFVNCNGQKSQLSNMITEELKWKNEWIDVFFLEYRSYEENDLIKCYDKDRSVSFDIERKVRAIHKFSFEATLSELSRFLTSNSIEFDSLIMHNYHTFYYEKDYSYPSVNFYLHSKGEILMRIAYYFNAEKKFTIEEHKEDVKDIYKYSKNLQNGCGYGFDTFTLFNKDLSSWKIKRIVINADE